MGVNKLCLLIVRRAGDKTAEITELGLGASATHTHTHARTHQTTTLALITTSQAAISKIYHIIIKLSSCLLQQLLCSYIHKHKRENFNIFVILV